MSGHQPPVPTRAVGNATVASSVGRTQLDIHQATDGTFVAWIVSRCVATTQGPYPGDSVECAMEPMIALPAGGISENRAIALADSHTSPDSVFVSASAGRFVDLEIDPGAGRGVEPNRLAWAITYMAQMTICPPNGGSCQPPQAGTLVVYLDFYTGEFLLSEGVSPDR